MRETPQFVREFSKEELPEERQETAQAIKAARSEYFSKKRSQTEQHDKLRETTGERERVLAEQLDKIRNLEGEITELTALKIGELMHYFKLKKNRADIAIGQKTYEELKLTQNTETAEAAALSEDLASNETSPKLEEARAMLDNFYKEQKEKWAASEYTKEDITKYFSEEHLASLSLKDYAILLKRFPREMVTHVTRQGVRDHVGHIFHTAGAGAYADGFMKIAKDGRLLSPLVVYLGENEKEQSIAKFLRLDAVKNEAEARKTLAAITSDQQGDPGSYADRMAVHFATEEVADAYYGSEKGNEIFIAYPSAYIASQYYFNGQLDKQGGGYWNDQWVWANEERGMDINAGVVFIPEEARVDKTSGSRYELDEEKNPSINIDYIEAFKKIASMPDFPAFTEQAMEITGAMTRRWNDPDPALKNQKAMRELAPFRQRLEKEFGITDPRLQFAILDYHVLNDLIIQRENQKNGREDQFFSIESIAKKALEQEGILFKESLDTISAKEFWEKYFIKNPASQPSKIVYYRDGDPTNALWQWRQENGIDKKGGSSNIGFAERSVARTVPEATAGIGRFKALAEKVIEDYFAKKQLLT